MGFLMYLMLKLNDVKQGLSGIGAALIVGTLVVTFIYGFIAFLFSSNEADYETIKNSWLKHRKKITWLFILGVVVYTIEMLLPSTEQMAIIIGVDKLTTSPEIGNILNQLYQNIMATLTGKG